MVPRLFHRLDRFMGDGSCQKKHASFKLCDKIQVAPSDFFLNLPSINVLKPFLSLVAVTISVLSLYSRERKMK